MAFYYPLPEKQVKSKKKVYDCETCGLYKNEKLVNPKYRPIIGDKYDGLVIVAEKPSVEDDQKGIPLFNDKAKLVRSAFLKHKLNLAQHGAIIYALACQTKKASDIPFKCCRQRLADDLNALKPKVIITLGEHAFKYVMNLKNKVGITKVRNRIIPNFEFNSLVFPIFNPNIVNSHHYKFAIERDIMRICDLWHRNYRKRTYINDLLKSRKILDGITIHEVKPNELDDVLNMIHTLKDVAFDYETTNLKPYDEFFNITHIQFGLKHTAWVLHEALWENNPEVWQKVKSNVHSFLINPDIVKIIQNAKFEDLCSRWAIGVKKIINTFDPMLATHVIDERRGCTSLDFQNLVRFGIPPYSETVKSFLEIKSKDDFTNNIRQAPHDDMILYAGLDAITTFNQFDVIFNEIFPNIYPEAFDNYEFLLKGHQVFANMSHRGIPIDGDAYEEFSNEIDNRIYSTLSEISKIPEFIEFNEYLKTKDGVKKDSDKVLFELINATKGERSDEDESREDTGKSSTTRRKISFE